MAVPPLEALVAAGFEVALVVTGADKRRGRRAEPTPTPVKRAALGLGLAVSHDLADVAGAGADLGVVVAYGRILRREILEALPMVNLHFSLLPRWRGAAPVERALLAGDDRTGVCIMAVEEGLDTGGVYASTEVAIDGSSTADQLGAQLTSRGARLLVETLQSGLGAAAPQVGDTTYAAKITTTELELDWERPAEELDRVVRVGGAWTTFRGRRLKVQRARACRDGPDDHGTDDAGSEVPGTLHSDRVTCGHGSLQLIEVQPEGKAAMASDAWTNGARPDAGERLGSGAGS